MTARLTEVSPAALPLTEAAQYLGVSKRTLQALHANGDIEFTYITSHPVVKVADLDALLASAPTERAS